MWTDDGVVGVGDVVSAFEAVCPLSGCFMDEGDHRHVWQWVWRCLQVFVLHAERGWCVPFVKCRRHALVFGKHFLCFSTQGTCRQSPSITQACVRCVVVG